MVITDHMLPVPFPDANQAAESIQILIEAVTDSSAGHDSRCVVGASCILIFYAGGKMTEGDTVVPHAAVAGSAPTGKEERLKLLQNAKDEVNAVRSGGRQAAAAIPWALLLDMAYQLLKEWLNS